MHPLNAARISETSPDAHRKVIGAPQPTDEDIAGPWPPFTELAALDGDVAVTYRPRGTAGLAMASPRLIRWIWSQLPRHPLGTPTTDEDGRRRRLDAFVPIAAQLLPQTIRPECMSFVVGHMAHVAIGACGLRIEDVVEALVKKGLRAEDVEAWSLSALEGGSFYEFDVAGRELDAKEAAKQATVETQVRIEEDLALPATQTLDDLGWVGFVARADADVPLALRTMHAFGANGSTYSFVPKSLLLGALVPEGSVTLGVEILDGSFAVPCTRGQLENLRVAVERSAYGRSRHGLMPTAVAFLEWFFEKVRPVKIGAQPGVVEQHDETTQDGCHRVELLEALLADEWFAYGDTLSFRLRLLFEAGRDGLSLADDVVAGVMFRRVREKWLRDHPKPENWDRAESEKAKSVTLYSGLAGMSASSPYVPQAWAPPPLPAGIASEQALLDRCRRLSGGKPPLFGADELYVAPEPGLADRVKTGDDWAPTIEAYVTGNSRVVGKEEIVATPAIDDALRAAELLAGDPTPRQYGRIHRIMTKLGWIKTDRAIDGRKTKVWVKTPGAERWAK